MCDGVSKHLAPSSHLYCVLLSKAVIYCIRIMIDARRRTLGNEGSFSNFLALSLGFATQSSNLEFQNSLNHVCQVKL
jgi:hypothetical protein